MNFFPESIWRFGPSNLPPTINATIIIAMAVSILPAGLLPIATAQTDSRWIAADGDWDNPANWDNGIPIGDFNAIVETPAGNLTQNLSGLAISGLQLASPTGNIILDHPLNVDQQLNWNSGQISGAAVINSFGKGQIADGVLETTLNNFGQLQFLDPDSGFPVLDSLTGATFNNMPGAMVELVEGTRFGNFVESAPGLIVNQPGATFLIGNSGASFVWDVVNDGLIEIDDSIVLFLGSYQQSPVAHLKLNGGTADFFDQVQMLGKVSGTGSVLNLGAIDFEALLEPGGDAIGMLQFGGDLRMTPKSVSNFQIGPELTSDLVTNIGGALQLDGTLNIEALAGATPGTYTLFTYNNNFLLQVDAIGLGSVPTGFNGFLFHDPASMSVNLEVLELATVLAGDVNLDGLVNLLDVAPFVELISSGEYQAEADINQDGSVNLLDVDPLVELLEG